MEYAVVNIPAAPVRRKPNHQSEMVNQLLFGETVEVLKFKGDLWVRIRSLHDNYEGWITSSMLEEVGKDFATHPGTFATTDILGRIEIAGEPMHIPFGSSLPFFENGRGQLGRDQYDFTGNACKRDEQKPGVELLKQLTLPWLNAPYLWGGRTPLGVDCSGFVQVIYKMMGIDLPRDTWQQAGEGRPCGKFKEALPGDLVYFDNREEIVHVGILLGDDQIIHASGRVRIDGITKKGIINMETGKRTLKLRAIRRLYDT